MAVVYNPFISKYGFKSDGFEVDSSGNIFAGNIETQNISVNNDIVADSIDVSTIKLDGSVLFGVGEGSQAFQLEKDFIISEGSTPYLSIINGQVTINNRFDSVGKIDNVDIGTIVPAIGNFTDLNSSNITSNVGIFSNIKTSELGIPVLESNTNLELSATNAIIFRINNVNKGRIDSLGIDIPIVNTTINNTSIGTNTPSTGAFTSVTVTDQPTSAASVTRKDYVDNQISAFSIAFGI